MPAHGWGDGVHNGRDIGPNPKAVRDALVGERRKAKEKKNKK